MSFKIAVVGLGKIAQDQHLPVLAKHPDFHLAAVVSQRGLQHTDTPSYRTLDELFAAQHNVNAVAICTPPSVRFEIAKQALAAGKHVLLEKPPTPTLAELFALSEEARSRSLVLFTTWHSQYNTAVAEAKSRLEHAPIRSLDVEWREDVRRWHPGQEWIWQPGGFGVFDPGINALSILTALLPSRIFVKSAELSFPSNRDTPIAASLLFKHATDAEAQLKAEFDWRQEGEQTWNITFELAEGTILKLKKGGSRLEVDGKLVVERPPAEYQGIYDRFAELLKRGQSDVEFAPLQLAADAFLVGRRKTVEPFT